MGKTANINTTKKVHKSASKGKKWTVPPHGIVKSWKTYANRIFTAGTKPNIWIAYGVKPNKDNVAAYLGDIPGLIRNCGESEESKTLYDKLDINGMVLWRGCNGEELMLSPTSTYAWMMFVKVLENKEDNFHAERRWWIEKKLVKGLNDHAEMKHRDYIASESGYFWYPTTYRYAGDLTEENDTYQDYPPLDQFTTTEQAAMYMKEMFCTTCPNPYEVILDEAENFFSPKTYKDGVNAFLALLDIDAWDGTTSLQKLAEKYTWLHPIVWFYMHCIVKQKRKQMYGLHYK